MAAESFRRVRGFMVHQRGHWITSQVCGFLVGVSYVAWMILLVLFVAHLLDRGYAEFRDSPRDKSIEAQIAANLSSDRTALTRISVPESPDPVLLFQKESTGMLPFVVRHQNKWFGFILQLFYEKQSWTWTNVGYLVGLMVIALVLGAFRTVLHYIQNLAVVAATTNTTTNLQRAVFRQTLELGTHTFRADLGRQIGPLLQEKLPAIDKGLYQWLQTQVREPAKIACLVAFVLVANPLLGISFLLMVALCWVLGSQMLERIATRRLELATAAEEQLHRVLGLANKLGLIKGYAAEVYFQQQYEEHLARYQNETLARRRYQALVSPLWQFVGVVVVVVVLALGAHNILTDKFALSTAAGVYASLISLVFPANNLLQRRQAIRTADAAAILVFDFLDQKPDVIQHEGAKFLQPLQTALEFEKVTYKDARARTLVNDLSIRIHSGQRVAFLSRDPAETHAFVYLLTRFIDPTTGRIRIDGQDLRDVTIESLRSQICLVLQSDLLFPDTVTNNIGCGDPGFSVQQITEASKVAHAHNFILHLPHGYECLIGEEGFPLKVGESFRIALARAILRDPPIVIIEEPKAALDADTKALLDDTMTRFFRDRTVILLPHRHSTLRNCDQIFILEDGKLVSCGTHRELVETSELYRHMQYSEFQVMASPR